MSRFEQFWWYVGVAVASVALIISVFQGDWVLAIICAFVAIGLKKLQPKIEIPEVYAKRGIRNDMFTPGGMSNEKNHK